MKFYIWNFHWYSFEFNRKFWQTLKSYPSNVWEWSKKLSGVSMNPSKFPCQKCTIITTSDNNATNLKSIHQPAAKLKFNNFSSASNNKLGMVRTCVAYNTKHTMHFSPPLSFISIKVVVFYGRNKIIPAIDGQCLKCSILTMCQHIIGWIAVNTSFLPTNKAASDSLKYENQQTCVSLFPAFLLLLQLPWLIIRWHLLGYHAIFSFTSFFSSFLTIFTTLSIYWSVVTLLCFRLSV